MSGLVHKIGGFFGASTPGDAMSAEDSAQEDKIQEALDKAYGTAGTFGQRKISADDAENALRAQGILPQGWRLRESDSTSSGYRPTKAASKKLALLHAGEVAGAAFGGLGAMGIGPLAAAGGAGAGAGGLTGGLNGAAGVTGVLSNPLVQGGIRTGIDAAQGNLSPWSALNFAGAVPGGSVGGAISKNPLVQKGINFGVNTGINTARTGQFNPLQTAVGAGTTFMPTLTGALPGGGGSPLTQRLSNFGGQQALNLGFGGRFDPIDTGLGGLSAFNPKVGQQVRSFIPGRASGGDVDPNKPYVVGEKGPEVVVPKTAGTVIPNAGGVGVGEQHASVGLPNGFPAAAPASQPGGGFAGFWNQYGGPITTLGGGYLGSLAARKAQQSAQERSPEEQLAIDRAMGPGGPGSVATSLMEQSRPYISQPASYYQTLLNGNRAAMAQATAPQRAALNESYRGASSKLATSGVRGAARDVLGGDLDRQRAAQVAGLTTGVQPAAAAALAQLGQGLQQSAGPLYGQAQSFYGQLLNQGLDNRKFAAGEGEKTGKEVGGLISQLANVKFGQGTAGKKSTSQVGTPPPGIDYGSTATVPEPGVNDRVLTGPGGFSLPQPGVLDEVPAPDDTGDYSGGEDWNGYPYDWTQPQG